MVVQWIKYWWAPSGHFLARATPGFCMKSSRGNASRAVLALERFADSPVAAAAVVVVGAAVAVVVVVAVDFGAAASHWSMSLATTAGFPPPPLSSAPISEAKTGIKIRSS